MGAYLDVDLSTCIYNILLLLFITSSTAQGGGGSFRIGNL